MKRRFCAKVCNLTVAEWNGAGGGAESCARYCVSDWHQNRKHLPRWACIGTGGTLSQNGIGRHFLKLLIINWDEIRHVFAHDFKLLNCQRKKNLKLNCSRGAGNSSIQQVSCKTYDLTKLLFMLFVGEGLLSVFVCYYFILFFVLFCFSLTFKRWCVCCVVLGSGAQSQCTKSVLLT